MHFQHFRVICVFSGMHVHQFDTERKVWFVVFFMLTLFAFLDKGKFPGKMLFQSSHFKFCNFNFFTVSE